MKYIFTLSICLCLLHHSKAQSTEQMMKTITLDFCDELQKKDFSVFKSRADLEVQLGLLMLPLLTKYEKEIDLILEKEDNTSKKDKMNLFGRKLGMQAVVDCPKFLEVLGKNSKITSEIVGEPDDEIVDNEKSVSTSVITTIVGNDISYIVAKDLVGRETKYYWLGYFQGDDLLKTKSALNKKIKISFIEQDLYSYQLKDYIKIKVLTGIKIIE